MTKRAYVITRWAGDGQTLQTAFRPELGVDYPLLTCRDVVGHPSSSLPPSPNIYVAEVTVDDAVAAQIAADGKYRYLTTDQLDNVPGAAAFTAVTNWLVTKSGRSLAQVQAVIGATVAGRTWREIFRTLIEWMKARPRG